MSVLAVFDTNVLFSAVGWKGAPFQCIELARAGVMEGVTCQEILDELADKLGSKLGFSPQEVAESLADVLVCLRIQPITGTLRAIVDDPDDDKVVECAVLAGADYLVTGDRRHLLPLGSFQGIQIVTPAEMLSRVSAP